MPIDSQGVGSVLVVQPESLALCSLPFACRFIHVRYCDNNRDDGLSAWIVAESTNSLTVSVEESCRNAPGRFSAHALTRFLAREVLRKRPACVLVRGTDSCLLDLVRVADLLGVPAFLDLSAAVAAAWEETPWFRDCLQRATLIFYHGESSETVLTGREGAGLKPFAYLADFLRERIAKNVPTSAGAVAGRLDYAIREFVQRDQPLLVRMQLPEVDHFLGCRRVLDLGCGAGIFLQLLADVGISAEGVERNERIAAYGRGMGLHIATADAVEYVATAKGFDGIYASHFVEHLSVESVSLLLARIARVLKPGGVLVLVFPDPESIRSQLLGFWRDPEHVRFYHPELVEGMALMHGLVLEWSNHEMTSREVGHFPLYPPPLPAPQVAIEKLPAFGGHETFQKPKIGWWQSIKGKLGLVDQQQMVDLQKRLDAQEERLTALLDGIDCRIEVLAERTERLWHVNRTWAWPDNAVLRFRKH